MVNRKTISYLLYTNSFNKYIVFLEGVSDNDLCTGQRVEEEIGYDIRLNMWRPLKIWDQTKFFSGPTLVVDVLEWLHWKLPRKLTLSGLQSSLGLSPSDSEGCNRPRSHRREVT